MPGLIEEITDRLSTRLASREDPETAALLDALRTEGRRVAARMAELETLATHDPLTGVLNRRGFDGALDRAIAGAARSGKGGVLVMIDLDGFKPVNDSYGHAAGDEVLKRVAGLLKAGVRANDVVARIGGDEFVVLLTETDRDDGVERAETLGQAINSAVAMWRGSAIQLHASLGLQSYDADDQQHALMGAADRAMYRIKTLRRSQPGTGPLSRAR